MTAKPKEIWLRTDEIEELVSALEHCAELASGLESNLMNWKWLIIALHNALQGACVCALRGRDNAGITMLTKKSAKEVWHWLDVESRKSPAPPMPEERLAAMPELYQRVADTTHLPDPCRLPTDPSRDDDVKRLNRLRNRFIHFVPAGFSLEVSGMPRIVGHCCDAIEHLSVKYPTYWGHLNNKLRRRTKTALANLRGSILAWAARHGLKSGSQ